MPLTLAVAGLTTAEKGALVVAIKAQAKNLTAAWTLFWDPSYFPERPDGLLYCPKRDEGRKWASKLAAGPCLLVAALPPNESTPSEVPLFVRMPFSPQEIVDALNIAAKRVLSAAPEESLSAPVGAEEEKVDLHVTVRGASRVDPLALLLYAVFQGADKTRFYKLRQAGGIGIEVWCWPDLNLYWSEASEPEILASGGAFDIFNCQGKRAALAAKSASSRPSGPLLWRAGSRAFKTAEILPWLAADQKMTLRRWPRLPPEARSIPLIRVFSRLTKSDATFSELLMELKIGRRDLCSIINGLVTSGDLARAKDARPPPPPSVPAGPAGPFDPEQAIFLGSLAIRCAESLAAALSAESPPGLPSEAS